MLLSGLAETAEISLATVLGIRLFLDKDDHAHRRLVQLVERLASDEPAPDAFLLEPPALGTVHEVSGSSAAAEEIRTSIERIADAPEHLVVLVTGETGTGKDRYALAIHRLSPTPRCQRPFEAVNCTEAPTGLFESTMFGHEKSAFTGANDRQPGFFELAADGTLFLDEVGEVPMAEQPKLLRAIETRSYRPLGARERRPLRARIIAATNRDLGRMVEAGTFRADLYHRLNGLPLRLPSLTERKEDIPCMIEQIAAEVAPGRELTPGAIAVLTAMPWPGNVRELGRAVERLFAMSVLPRIDVDTVGRVLGPSPEALPRDARIRHLATEIDALGGLEALRRVEAEIVRQKLDEADGNRTRAARALGLSRKQVARLAEDVDASRGAEARRPGSGVFRIAAAASTGSRYSELRRRPG